VGVHFVSQLGLTATGNERKSGIARVRFLPGKLKEWKHLTEQTMDRVT
jgi:hypothetical protein